MAQAKGEKHYNWGKYLSEATKEKIRKSMTGRHHSEATKKKISISQKKIIRLGTNLPIESRFKSGADHYNWKGGIVVNSKGYVLIWKPSHPYSNCRGYVRRSRCVMEQHIGRYLNPKEIAHHKNEIKHDDRIENLDLFPSKAKHTSFHHHLRSGLSLQIDGC